MHRVHRHVQWRAGHLFRARRADDYRAGGCGPGHRNSSWQSQNNYPSRGRALRMGVAFDVGAEGEAKDDSEEIPRWNLAGHESPRRLKASAAPTMGMPSKNLRVSKSL